ncbi:DUF1289 domain-containing protein [Zhongshania sp.]|uniref:DUF1289 domain-containing protein n=1 Tax=Zhongshania sp. TaxID=1971902 RepID=UPI003569950E
MSVEIKEKPVASPCISVCALDEYDICTGCYRSLQEIGDWSELSNMAKREVVFLANRRCKDKYGL